MNHFQGIDPYKILGIQPNVTINEARDAYRQLARVHHPDKGGNPETFKIIKLAFKMIIDNIKKGVPIPQQNSTTFVEMREASQNYQNVQKQPEPHEFFGRDQHIDPNREFDGNVFNQKFIQNRKENDDYLLVPSDNDYRENRTKQQLLSEQADIDNELGMMKPMFSGRDFNNNAFQRMFEFVNGTPEANTKAMQVYDEPQALVSGLQPFTEIDETHKIKQTDK
jgi:DnaJ-class molecular chaperone